jgi:acyl-[acyl carrier protein]--UDP-N-acetylglucosamine O-acyltransferase
MIHETAIIGDPPEHRDWKPGDPKLAPVIDPTARINSFVTVDAGLHEPTRIGARTFCMTKTHVGHDAQIGDDCELAPGTVIGGHAVLGNGVRCGIGVLVLPFKRVGKGVRLGAGAVVTKDVPPGEIWVGNPASPLHKKQDDLQEWRRWWDESRSRRVQDPQVA